MSLSSCTASRIRVKTILEAQVSRASQVWGQYAYVVTSRRKFVAIRL